MSLKSQILTQLKEYVKAKGINLSNVRINAFADKLDAYVDKEDAIKEEIEKLDALVDFKELASLDDAKRTLDKRKAKDDDEKDDPKPDPTGKESGEAKKPGNPDGDDTPGWFKQYTEQQNKLIESLTKELATIKAGDVAKSRRALLERKLDKASDTLKKTITSAFGRMKFETDEEFNEYLAEIEQTVTEDVQARVDAGLGLDAPAKVLGGGKLGEKEVSPMMKSFLDEQKAVKGNATATKSA